LHDERLLLVHTVVLVINLRTVSRTLRHVAAKFSAVWFSD